MLRSQHMGGFSGRAQIRQSCDLDIGSKAPVNFLHKRPVKNIPGRAVQPTGPGPLERRCVCSYSCYRPALFERDADLPRWSSGPLSPGGSPSQLGGREADVGLRTKHQSNAADLIPYNYLHRSRMDPT
ncbi:hypothetical protein DPEC_G00287310 [Dallia pectoralis]|uniref:Uncharacterized protein n=1 Tax=Dallia pectoralis TaxID=75939 RepID=A0ACC2FK51_DALPE|nr:hypothetical protein DPEC_G00287310 [Dallia pectoralis]